MQSILVAEIGDQKEGDNASLSRRRGKTDDDLVNTNDNWWFGALGRFKETWRCCNFSKVEESNQIHIRGPRDRPRKLTGSRNGTTPPP